MSVLIPVASVGVLSGCASMKANLGIRPDEPKFERTEAPCSQYETYSGYAQQLQEAYHSRGTQNRGWIYVAGVVGLGVAAATGGLALAGALGATGLGLLATSGGFASGGFATINNEALAFSYTVAANTIDEAAKTARSQLALSPAGGANGTTTGGARDTTGPSSTYTDSSCVAALS
jgi:hypothetical protein